jgi:thiol-disulfide isomerase/thioredoxin
MALGSRGRTIALVFGGVLGFSAIAGWVIGGDGEQIDTITAESDGTLPNGGMSSELDGRPLPDLELAALDGTKVNLSSLGGDGVPLLINLWAESCKACRDEMPDLERASQEFGDRLHIVGLNVEDSASQASDYADKVGVTYQILIDPANLVLNEFQVPALPATLIVGGDGVIQHLHLGVLTADRLRTLVPEELGQ